VFAGALGVRLGGPLAYGGRAEWRPVLGGAGRPVEVADIERAVRLSRRVSLAALALTVAGRLAASWLARSSGARSMVARSMVARSMVGPSWRVRRWRARR
ncbi:MAG TPA: hypothetical protein VGR21_12340, partial [Cryptosporangiaceae bacterium]|nr:hypothetical protein [Cryptosporangiaceae bacterium]